MFDDDVYVYGTKGGLGGACMQVGLPSFFRIAWQRACTTWCTALVHHVELETKAMDTDADLLPAGW